MKAVKSILLLSIFIAAVSCGHKENKLLNKLKKDKSGEYIANIPLDKGFSEFITGYTSGIVPSNSAIEIRFTPEFASKADKSAT